MVQTGDFINLYYNGKPDTWNAKPPLLIWSIAASYKLFGFNEFALRFPSAISVILFFIFCFYTIALLESAVTAFLTCLILLSTKAILGNHIGLTGDFDATLVMLLTASVYFFISYVELGRRNAIYLVGIFTGLAFYCKGPASLTLIPGFILYLVIRRRSFLFKDSRLWISAFIFLLIAGSWLVLVQLFGHTTDVSFYGSKNSVETMFIYDTFSRLTTPGFENLPPQKNDFLFFITVLDARINLWNYIFYIAVAYGITILYKRRATLKTLLMQQNLRLTVLSTCLIVPLALVLTFAATKHNWYLAPVFMFIVFIVARFCLWISTKWKIAVGLVFGILLVFTFCRQVSYILTLPTELNQFFRENKKLTGEKVIVGSPLRQNILLYLKWNNCEIVQVPPQTDLTIYSGSFAFLSKEDANEINQNERTCLSQYCYGRLD